nr:hypothetical protein [uncultured Niameybacter sp.]
MGSYCVKIKKSLLKDTKITIRQDEIQSLFENAIEWDVGYAEEIVLRFNNETYSGRIAYKPRNAKKNGGNPYYQLSYTKKLGKELQKEFIHTMLAIQNKGSESNKEVLQLKSNISGEIELIPFIKHKTEYDEFFKKVIEWNILDLYTDKKDDKANDIIIYSSDWIDKEELEVHKSVNYVVYYLMDTQNKEIYIGCCTNLGDRGMESRREIPGWNKFKYEVINPKYWGIREKIEEHVIRAFASIMKNGGNQNYFPITEYKLKNKRWQKRK